MSVVVLLGAPGAGKGTQAPILAQQLGVPVLGSGDLLRAAVDSGTTLGRAAEGYMRRGQLVPDETIVDIVLDRLTADDAAAGAVLDGFPRTRGQAEALDSALQPRAGRVDLALFIEMPTDSLVARLAGRRICAANGHVYNDASNPARVAGICDVDGSELVQRNDDREEIVRARLAQQIPPLLEVVDHYRATGILRTIDGLRPIAAVTASLLVELPGSLPGGG